MEIYQYTSNRYIGYKITDSEFPILTFRGSGLCLIIKYFNVKIWQTTPYKAVS